MVDPTAPAPACTDCGAAVTPAWTAYERSIWLCGRCLTKAGQLPASGEDPTWDWPEPDPE